MDDKFNFHFHPGSVKKELRECTCGAQTFSENASCPKCGSKMEPMPAKKPAVARA